MILMPQKEVVVMMLKPYFMLYSAPSLSAVKISSLLGCDHMFIGE
jgi:hypothetical protein